MIRKFFTEIFDLESDCSLPTSAHISLQIPTDTDRWRQGCFSGEYLCHVFENKAFQVIHVLKLNSYVSKVSFGKKEEFG